MKDAKDIGKCKWCGNTQVEFKKCTDVCDYCWEKDNVFLSPCCCTFFVDHINNDTYQCGKCKKRYVIISKNEYNENEN